MSFTYHSSRMATELLFDVPSWNLTGVIVEKKSHPSSVDPKKSKSKRKLDDELTEKRSKQKNHEYEKDNKPHHKKKRPLNHKSGKQHAIIILDDAGKALQNTEPNTNSHKQPSAKAGSIFTMNVSPQTEAAKSDDEGPSVVPGEKPEVTIKGKEKKKKIFTTETIPLHESVSETTLIKSKTAITPKKISAKEKIKLKKAINHANTIEAKFKPLASKTLNFKSSTTSTSNFFSAKNASLTPLQEKMRTKLSGARFRWINEQLYTTSSVAAFTLFQQHPEMFDEYHEGFRSQVVGWPKNPVDYYISYLRMKPKETVIADLGCGDARIAGELVSEGYKILSFDLVANNERIIPCDIANVPLPGEFVDIAIFCLSLMGTNYIDFLKEAHRILKTGGELKIAEVVSRFSDIDAFVEVLQELGFQYMKKDESNKMFILFDFTKASVPKLKGKSKNIRKTSDLLKPCVYKKR